MSTEKGKKKKKTPVEAKVVSWQEKRNLADEEEEALEKEVEELKSWTNMMDNMDDQQLKEYLKNRPDHLKSMKIEKTVPKKRVQKAAKDKSSASTGIMASVWKFHKEDDEGSTTKSDV
ncbi:hypothetical protein L1049_026485 [Liquidambar formosana]|uniref:Uncharacterized protein n=1 Tax=Liquidambar formosana TaxID=63359 RepID=A0AAP0R7D7_LIQFO